MLDESGSPAAHLTITAPSGFLVKAEEAGKGSIGDEKVEMNALIARHGLGVRLGNGPKSGEADAKPQESNPKSGD